MVSARQGKKKNKRSFKKAGELEKSTIISNRFDHTGVYAYAF